jgi:hypothetical protein
MAYSKAKMKSKGDKAYPKAFAYPDSGIGFLQAHFY